MTDAARPNRRRALRRSWCWVVGSGLTMAAGWSARVRPEAATWFGVRGPYCPLGSCLGEQHCPGCGLVRSTSAALQGDLGAAWAFHPGGVLIAALLLVTFALHLDILRRGREGLLHVRLRRTGYILLWTSVLLGWAVRYLTRT